MWLMGAHYSGDGFYWLMVCCAVTGSSHEIDFMLRLIMSHRYYVIQWITRVRVVGCLYKRPRTNKYTDSWQNHLGNTTLEYWGTGQALWHITFPLCKIYNPFSLHLMRILYAWMHAACSLEIGLCTFLFHYVRTLRYKTMIIVHNPGMQQPSVVHH